MTVACTAFVLLEGCRPYQTQVCHGPCTPDVAHAVQVSRLAGLATLPCLALTGTALVWVAALSGANPRRKPPATQEAAASSTRLQHRSSSVPAAAAASSAARGLRPNRVVQQPRHMRHRSCLPVQQPLRQSSAAGLAGARRIFACHLP